MSVVVLLLLAVVVVVEVLAERTERARQRRKFAAVVRDLDVVLRARPEGYAVTDISFRPGFRRGRGTARWDAPTGYSVAEIEVPRERRPPFLDDPRPDA